MRAGQLRDIVRFEREVKVPDGGGGYDLSWVPLLSVRGHLVLERGRERIEAGRIEAAVSGVLRVRWQNALQDLSAADRAVVNDVAYNIKSDPINPDRRRRMLEMNVERGGSI